MLKAAGFYIRPFNALSDPTSALILEMPETAARYVSLSTSQTSLPGP